MDKPKISIIIPVYNVENYLNQCLESVVNQTYQNLEIIVINDGSTDNSAKICDEFAYKDNRIIVIHKENGGISSARNIGIEKSSGEYIMFLDSDDWIELNTCEIALKIAEEQSADVVFWPYIREFTNTSKKKKLFDGDFIVFDGYEVKKKLHRRMIGIIDDELSKPENADAIVTVWGKLYRSHLIKKNNIRFVDTNIIGSSEDALFNLYVFKYVRKAVYISKYLYHYRRNNISSFTTIYNENLFHQWFNLFDLMNKYIKDHNLGEEYYQALSNRIALGIIGLGINETNNKKGHLSRIRNIKKILSNNKYRNAFSKLRLKYFPLHWKIFFFFAKINCSILIYMFLLLIDRMRRN